MTSIQSLKSIDAFRGIAALWVVLYHAHRLCIPDQPEQTGESIGTLPLRLGYLGVTLFLVISGFCIHLSVAAKLNHSSRLEINWLSFWRRRFWRLYPTYVAAIVFSLPFLAVIPGFWPDHYLERAFFGDVLTHSLLIHNFFLSYHDGLGNGVYWTLGLEVQLYCLYAMFLTLRRRLTLSECLIIVLLTTVMWKATFHLLLQTPNQWTFKGAIGQEPWQVGIWLQWPFAYWFSWVLGAVSAEVLCGTTKPSRIWSSITTALIFLTLGVLTSEHVFLGSFNPSPTGLIASMTGISNWQPLVSLLSACSEPFIACGFCIILTRAAISEKTTGSVNAITRAIAPLGEISFSVYLMHIPVLLSFYCLLDRHAIAVHNPFLRIQMGLIASVLVASILYRVVEIKFTRRRATST